MNKEDDDNSKLKNVNWKLIIKFLQLFQDYSKLEKHVYTILELN